MTELELFAEWCNYTVEMQIEIEKQMNIENEPKWKVLQSGNRSNKHECKAALEMINKFKEFKGG